MDNFETMNARHSVRAYNSKPIPAGDLKALQAVIDECNAQGGLHIQLCLNEPQAFGSFMAHYGKFRNVNHYFALIGAKSEQLEEKIGYYGERIVLKATELGIGTCWVAATYSKGKCGAVTAKDEKLVCVISFGLFDVDGVPHKTKGIEQLSHTNGLAPEWFLRGMKAAQLAPTAVNQQKFFFTLDGETVTAKAGSGFYTKLDLGIAKYHFELGAGKENFRWAK